MRAPASLACIAIAGSPDVFFCLRGQDDLCDNSCSNRGFWRERCRSPGIDEDHFRRLHKYVCGRNCYVALNAAALASLIVSDLTVKRGPDGGRTSVQVEVADGWRTSLGRFLRRSHKRLSRQGVVSQSFAMMTFVEVAAMTHIMSIVKN